MDEKRRLMMALASALVDTAIYGEWEQFWIIYAALGWHQPKISSSKVDDAPAADL